MIFVYVILVLTIFFVAWVLSGIVCPPRYTCEICEKPQWQKGKQVSEIQEFICEGCYKGIRDKATEELNYPTMERDGYRQVDKRLIDRIDEMIK
jgi:transposase-like protein